MKLILTNLFKLYLFIYLFSKAFYDKYIFIYMEVYKICRVKSQEN